MDNTHVGKFFTSARNLEHNLRKKYPYISSVEELIRDHISSATEESRTLDLGCGGKPQNPFRAREVHGTDLRDDLASL